jgi:hypothetical protein
MRSLDFSIDITLPAALWPWRQLSLWQKWVPGIFLGVKCGQYIRLTSSPRHLWADFVENVRASTSQKPMGLHSLLQDGFTFFLSQSQSETLYTPCSWCTLCVDYKMTARYGDWLIRKLDIYSHKCNAGLNCFAKIFYVIKVLPGNSSVNTICAHNSRASCVFRVSGSWHRIGDVTHQW